MAGLEGVLGEARAAAVKLRAKGKEEEAAEVDKMVVKLEAAVGAQREAEQRRQEAGLAHAEAEVAEQAAEVARVAEEVSAELEAAGCGEEAAKVKEWQKVAEGGGDGEQSGEGLAQEAHDAHELAAKLRLEGKGAEAADVEKLASMLDTAAEQKLQVEGMEKEKEAKQDLKEAAEVGHAAADNILHERAFPNPATLKVVIVGDGGAGKVSNHCRTATCAHGV